MRRTTLSLLAFLLLAVPVGAHEFWIEPSAHRPALGDLVKVRLLIGGHEDPGEPFARRETHIEAFEVHTPSGTRPVVGREGGDPAGLLRVKEAGLHLISYRSRPSLSVLEPAAFDAYLREEGLGHLAAWREKHGEAKKPGREAYARCAKALLRVGSAAAAGFDRVVGQTVELIPEQDPFALKAGDTLTVRVLYKGKPLEGLRVGAQHRTDRALHVMGRTDADGRVRLKLARSGAWLVHGLHMVRAPKGKDADWESFWASLTFELPAAVSKS